MKEYYMELYKESDPTNELQPVIEEANEKAARWKSGITFSKDNSSLNPAESKWTITEEELQCARSRLNNKKSSGEDGLSNYIIKKLPKLFWEITRKIFNNCMANSYFPRMDDLLFWCAGKFKAKILKNVTEGIEKLKKDMVKWDIHINETKTNIMVIPATHTLGNSIARDLQEDGIDIDDKTTIYAKEKIKYLGITIDSMLTHEGAVSHALSRAGTIYGKTKWILQRKATSLKVKRLIYKQLIRPNLTYGMQISPITTEDTLDKLGALERKIARCITNLYRRDNGKYYRNETLYKEMDLKDNIVEHINKLKEKYEVKKAEHQNIWYRNRMVNLAEKRLGRLTRNLEYKKTTKEWKEMKERQ